MVIPLLAPLIPAAGAALKGLFTAGALKSAVGWGAMSALPTALGGGSMADTAKAFVGGGVGGAVGGAFGGMGGMIGSTAGSTLTAGAGGGGGGGAAAPAPMGSGAMGKTAMPVGGSGPAGGVVQLPTMHNQDPYGTMQRMGKTAGAVAALVTPGNISLYKYSAAPKMLTYTPKPQVPAVTQPTAVQPQAGAGQPNSGAGAKQRVNATRYNPDVDNQPAKVTPQPQAGAGQPNSGAGAQSTGTTSAQPQSSFLGRTATAARNVGMAAAVAAPLAYYAMRNTDPTSQDAGKRAAGYHPSRFF